MNKQTKTVRVKLYQFEKLSKEAKAKAIDKLRDINVDYDWWDAVYEDFELICEKIGISVDLKKTYFSGFSHQGQGAEFSGDVNLYNLIKGINGETWREHAPYLDKENNFTPDKCTVSPRVLGLIQQGIVDFSVDFEGRDRGYPHTKANISYDYTSGNCVNYANIDKQLADLEIWIESIASELDALLFNMLEKEYDYQTSDEAIIETIQANEYWFTADGSIY